MVSRTPALDTLRDHILKTGSVFLHNMQWTPGVTCWTCAGIPNPGYDECYNCASRAGSPGLADKLGFVTYGWDGGQAGRVMYAYKANGATSYQVVSSLLTYAVARASRRRGQRPRRGR